MQVLAPLLTVADYGNWGSYVLSAPTLGQALKRAAQTVSLHANGDRVWIETGRPYSRLVYCFAARAHVGYPDIAYSSVGNLMSIPKHYIGQNWQSVGIEFDIPKPTRAYEVAEVFGCPVQFDARHLAILISNSDFSRPQQSRMPTVTLRDVVRERAGGPPDNFMGQVKEVVRLQLIESNPSVDLTAKMLNTGIRTLQRRLNSDGLTFRDLSNHIKMERSTELLRLNGETITSISNALGYSSPANFSRAFKTQTGLSPRAYRGILKG